MNREWKICGETGINQLSGIGSVAEEFRKRFVCSIDVCGNVSNRTF